MAVQANASTWGKGGDGWTTQFGQGGWEYAGGVPQLGSIDYNTNEEHSNWDHWEVCGGNGGIPLGALARMPQSKPVELNNMFKALGNEDDEEYSDDSNYDEAVDEYNVANIKDTPPSKEQQQRSSQPPGEEKVKKRCRWQHRRPSRFDTTTHEAVTESGRRPPRKQDKVDDEAGDIGFLGKSASGNGLGVLDGHNPEWACHEITIDSGAAESVASRGDFAGVPVTKGDDARNGVYYIAANGDEIYNAGEQEVAMVTADGPRSMRFQICDVTKTLASVSKICEKGHRVIFDDEAGSCIQHKSTGRVIPLEKKNGVYVLRAWRRNKHF